MSRVLQALERANSHWRYWAYRRSIGSPVSALGTLREWWTRFWFELDNIRRRT